MKMLSLVKAVFSQDMDLFKIKAKKESSQVSKLILPIVLFFTVSLSMGFYAATIAESLAPYHLTYVMLTIFMMMVTLLSFMQGIYKSQAILFDAKDNDLLFSLPIKKSTILTLRLLKLYIYQIIFNAMFIMPASIVYIYFEHPNIAFYLVTILMSSLLPIIPIIVSSFLGYLIKSFSSNFKYHKIIQTILSVILGVSIFSISFTMDSVVENIVEKSTSINNMISKLYYPIGSYINMITDFSIKDLLIFIIIHVIFFIIFILITTKKYFKIISKTKSNPTTNRKITGSLAIARTKLKSLTIKELKRYFSSPVYIFNTSFGLIIFLLLTFTLIIKDNSTVNNILMSYDIENTLSIELTYYMAIIMCSFMTSISSSSISLEGKTINITKSLPIKTKEIFNAKILSCFIIELPFIILSIILFAIKYKISIFMIFSFVATSILIILFNAIAGLIINLKYPKLNYTSEIEVVKQSMSAFISVLLGMGLGVLSIILIIKIMTILNVSLVMLLYIMTILIINLTCYKYLIDVGSKDYNKLQ